MNGSFIKRTLCAATILVAHAAFGADAELLTQLESKDSAVSLAAAQKLAASRSKLPKAAISPVISFVRKSASETADRRANKVKGPAKAVPFVGDETNLIRVKAEPRDYLDKEIQLSGSLSIGSYFGYGYRGSEETHYSLAFQPVNETAEFKRGESCIIYADRQVASTLAEAITYRQEKDFDGMLVRVKVVLLSTRAKDLSSTWNMLELRDWQFPSEDGKSWGPWSVERAVLVKQLVSKLPSDSGPAIADIILAGGDASGTAVHVVLLNHLMTLPRGSRQAIAKKVKQTAAKSIDAETERRAGYLADALDPRASGRDKE